MTTLTTLAPDDWRLFRLSRPNVLLIGPELDMDDAIASITGCPADSVACWTNRTAREPQDSSPDTIVVRNVMALDTAEQHRLNQFLEERLGGVRVIATTPEPMYSLVAQRRFLESLYYRLNIVCVESTALGASALSAVCRQLTGATAPAPRTHAVPWA